MTMLMSGVLIVVLGTAMWTDLRSSRIPNWLTFWAMAFALAAHAWLGGFREAIFGLAGLATGLGLFFVLYASGGVGAGDVKLMGAIGAMVGPYGVLVSGVLTLLVGGAYASALLAYEWSLGKPGRMYEKASFQLRYSVAIAGGTLLFLAGVHPLG